MKKILIFFILISLNCQSQTKIEIDFISGFNENEKKIVLDNISKLEKLINSKEFEEKIVNSKTFYRNKIPFISKKNKYTNTQILSILKSGKELNTIKDNIINLKLHLYDSKKNEIGHTDSNLQIHTHRGYFKNNPIEYYLSHILHEYCHTLGFKHSYWKLPFRSKTVPYKIGNITKELLTK
jgi:hypothetical protein